MLYTFNYMVITTATQLEVAELYNERRCDMTVFWQYQEITTGDAKSENNLDF